MISKKRHTTIGATRGYGLPRGFGSNHNTTFGYVVSKLIRTPLPLHTNWNAVLNNLIDSEKELMDFVCDNGTVEEVVRLRKLLTKVR